MDVNYQNLSSAVTYGGSFLMSCFRESFIKCLQKELFPLRPHNVVTAVENLFPMLNDIPLSGPETKMKNTWRDIWTSKSKKLSKAFHVLRSARTSK
jgi:hypothetical protein